MTEKRYQAAIEQYRQAFLASGKTAEEFEMEFRLTLAPGSWPEEKIREAIQLITRGSAEKMTNADKIRAMNDEELAACLATIAAGGLEAFDSRSCKLCQAKHGGTCPTGDSDTCLVPYDSEIMDWLKAPAEN